MHKYALAHGFKKPLEYLILQNFTNAHLSSCIAVTR